MINKVAGMLAVLFIGTASMLTATWPEAEAFYALRESMEIQNVSNQSRRTGKLVGGSVSFEWLKNSMTGLHAGRNQNILPGSLIGYRENKQHVPIYFSVEGVDSAYNAAPPTSVFIDADFWENLTFTDGYDSYETCVACTLNHAAEPACSYFTQQIGRFDDPSTAGHWCYIYGKKL